MKLEDSPRIDAPKGASRKADGPTLLVTWNPPGERNVGEVILRDLCRYFPIGGLHVFEVSRFPPLVHGYPGVRLIGPDEAAWRPLPGRLGGGLNHLWVRSRLKWQIDRIANGILDYARQINARRLWLTLSSPTLVRISAVLAARSDYPLRALVWDPPASFCRHQGWDAASVNWIERNFHQVMRRTQDVMVVSKEMAEQYSRLHGVRCTIVRHALPSSSVANRVSGAPEQFLIGFAGSIHDPSQLGCLIEALNNIGWRVGRKEIKLRIVGNYFRFNQLLAPANIELLGWRTPEATRDLLSECSICYLPMPFGERHAELVRLAFPTKLGTYLAARCPVLLHAPRWASVSSFCLESGIGVCCFSMDASELADAVQRAFDQVASGELDLAVSEVIESHFTERVMRTAFVKFMGLAEPDISSCAASPAS